MRTPSTVFHAFTLYRLSKKNWQFCKHLTFIFLIIDPSEKSFFVLILCYFVTQLCYMSGLYLLYSLKYMLKYRKLCKLHHYKSPEAGIGYMLWFTKESEPKFITFLLPSFLLHSDHCQKNSTHVKRHRLRFGDFSSI